MNDQFYIVDYYVARNPDNTSLSISTSGHQICAPKWAWGPGIRNVYILHYIKKGKGIYQTGEKTYSLKAGDVFIIFPHTLCYYEADQDDPWEYYWVGFSGAMVKGLFANTDFSVDTPCLTFDEDLSSCIQQILQCKGQNSYHQAEMVGHLYILFSKMMRKSRPKGISHDYRKDYVAKAHEYITQNYSNSITIGDLASYIGLSRSHLHRVFVEETGDSPIQYLTRYRIEQSLSLLKSTDMGIASIASGVGFSDQLYFSRVFSRLMGMSPSKYRKTAQEEK